MERSDVRGAGSEGGEPAGPRPRACIRLKPEGGGGAGSPVLAEGEVEGAVGAWNWFHSAEGVSSYLARVAERLEKGRIQAPRPDARARRARALAGRVAEFERLYSDCGDGVILGYFVVISDSIRVDALVARGEAEPAVEAVDVEWWLEEFERSGGVEEGRARGRDIR